MNSSKCIHCNKELPAGAVSNVCSLCAIGLIPTAPLTEPSTARANQYEVDGRVLSGIHCPACHAEFSLADLGHRHCSICGQEFSQDRIDQLVNQAQFARQNLPEWALKPRESGQPAWPDDAPLW